MSNGDASASAEVLLKRGDDGWTQILTELEDLSEGALHERLVASLTASPAGASPAAPWEWVRWAYERSKSEEFQRRIERCVQHVLCGLLALDQASIPPGVALSLGIVISHLRLRQLTSRLRDLIDRVEPTVRAYHGILVRQQLLYHLDSLDYQDHTYWLTFLPDPDLAPPAYLALARSSPDSAIDLVPYLLAARISDEALDSVLLQASQEPLLRGSGYLDRLRTLFQGKPTQAIKDALAALQPQTDQVGRGEHWEQLRKRGIASLQRLGITTQAASVSRPSLPSHPTWTQQRNGMFMPSPSQGDSTPGGSFPSP
ncbi:MAG TPA: hypothetical protein VF017_20745 [Thermoanaerobaculia bacterium]|nr:hypothetical protein [Thermoanaerobaculia bacterium]